VGEKSGIDYVDSSWGPWRGCTKVSQGCAHCYAERNMNRFPRTRAEWAAANRPDGVPTRASHATFFAPLRWPGGRKVFVCPWSDFWHEGVPAHWRDDALSVMDRRPDLTFIIPTKRPQHVLDQLAACDRLGHREHVWLLLSIEDQETADERLPWAARLAPYFGVVGISAEPLLGPIDLHLAAPSRQNVSWLVIGAESGPGARWGAPEATECLADPATWAECKATVETDCLKCRYVEEVVIDDARSLVAQAHAAYVLCYVKQQPIGGRLCTDPRRFPPDLRDRCLPMASRSTEMGWYLFDGRNGRREVPLEARPPFRSSCRSRRRSE